MSVFATGTDDATVNDVVLSTINTGELYGRHLQLARSNASDDDWFIHVRNVAMRHWRASGGSMQRMTVERMSEAGCLLREYYAQHICEM